YVNAISNRLQVVDKGDSLEVEFTRQRRRIDGPGQICDLDLTVMHRTGNTKARVPAVCSMTRDKLGYDRVEPSIVGAAIHLLSDGLDFVLCNGKVSDSTVGTADVTSQDNHFVLTVGRLCLHPRRCRSAAVLGAFDRNCTRGSARSSPKRTLFNNAATVPV